MPDRYTSQITFLYYHDFDRAIRFVEDVLAVDLVMDQGFARIYRIHDKAFLGIVKERDASIDTRNKGGVLISINVANLDAEYERVKALHPPGLTAPKTIERIPLRSFFFQDYEGYHYEMQAFLNDADRTKF